MRNNFVKSKELIFLRDIFQKINIIEQLMLKII